MIARNYRRMNTPKTVMIAIRVTPKIKTLATDLAENRGVTVPEMIRFLLSLELKEAGVID